MLAAAACGDAGGAPADTTPTDSAPSDLTDTVTLPESVSETLDITDDSGPDLAPEIIAPPADWDPEPASAMDCDPARAMPLLDALLTHAGLTRETFTFSPDDYAGSHYFARGDLDDPFLLPSFRPRQAAPLQSGCLAAELAGRVDAIAARPHPVATLIRSAARELDRHLDGAPVLPTPQGETSQAALAQAIAAAVAAAGHPYDPPTAAVAALPAALAADLVPIFVALSDALAAQRTMAAQAPTLTARGWIEEAGFSLVPAAHFQFLDKLAVREHLLGEHTLPPLFLAAARVAYAIESIDWSPHHALELTFDLATPIGRILIRGPAADIYPPAGPDTLPTLFLLDTGGDDVHRDDVGAVTDPRLGVSIAIDLGGDDHYTYDPIVDPASGLVSDDHGRYPAGDPASQNGPVTRSRHGRQGSGRHGVGMLFDLGQGADRYDSLAASQGYAALGVGVLFDDGGADHYTSEVASQGAAISGIGLLVDLGEGTDTYRLVNSGQGMAGVRGYGLLFDQAGDDTYEADPGPIAAADPTLAPQPLYFSPQMAGQANNSMAQGASTGIRWDARGLFLSGGIGVLRDAAGDDSYLAGLFAQGAGYWQGVGLLSDGDGRDRYDALYYVQGAGAHYALGLFMDGGQGGDQLNQRLPPQYVQVGSGHDFTLGVFVNEAGDDVYRYAGLAAGASNCNGLGLFVDNGGDDTYTTASDYGSGMGNVSGECLAARPLPKSVGLMLDAAGADTYAYPADSPFPIPSDGGTWGHVRNDLPSEHGAGLDAEGRSGLHAP